MNPQEDSQVTVLAEQFKGQVLVSVSKAVREEGAEDLKWALILKVMGHSTPNAQALANVMKRAWEMQAGVTFIEIENGLIVTKLDSEGKMRRVEEGAPWMFNGAAILVKRWYLGCKPAEIVFSSMPIWLQIHRLPIELRQESRAKGFAEVVGKVCKLPKEEQEVVRFKFVRFKVELNITIPLKQGCYLSTDEGPLWISFKYERLPTFCNKCGLIGHETRRCSLDLPEGRFGNWLRAESQSIGTEPPWAGTEESDSNRGHKDKVVATNITTASGTPEVGDQALQLQCRPRGCSTGEGYGDHGGRIRQKRQSVHNADSLEEEDAGSVQVFGEQGAGTGTNAHTLFSAVDKGKSTALAEGSQAQMEEDKR